MYVRYLEQIRGSADKIRKGEMSEERKTKREQTKSLLTRPSQEAPDLTDGEEGGPTFEELMLETFAALRDFEDNLPNYENTAENPRYTEDGQRRPKARGAVPRGAVPDKVYAGLIDRGVLEHVAKGLMLNFQDESGFKIDIEEHEPNVYGTRGKGLYQLTNDRRKAYEAKFGNDYSLDNQLDWLVYEELEGTENVAYNKMLAAPNAAEAAVVIVEDFLRPAEEHQRSRAQKYRNSTGYTPRSTI